MRSTARRVAELEQEAKGPVVVHAIKVHEQDEEQAKAAAFDLYGCARIKPGDITVLLVNFGARDRLDERNRANHDDRCTSS